MNPPPPPPLATDREWSDQDADWFSIGAQTRVEGEGLDGAVNPSAIKSLGTSTVIMANHLNNRMLEELPKKDRPTSIQLMRTYAEHPDLVRSISSCDGFEQASQWRLTGKQVRSLLTPSSYVMRSGKTLFALWSMCWGRPLATSTASKVSSWVAKSSHGPVRFLDYRRTTGLHHVL